ncbi:MFS transporter [Streptomyces sp. RPA4-2]|uniref:MFS transporter n=1 Tax=Streptomyces sp. RPA4-2 TaxID=2721244 RepID=UPI00143ECFA4|nr:MFS transporter [Streptomyces sp. RPA4-2]QIY65936.1 MFS transporter [Streptomyces sp. RPA4-2]
MTSPATRPDVKRGTIPVFATATAITVSNIYFTQPLLDEIARGFHTSSSTAALVATTGQIGYALGIIAIVPLADGVRLRRLSTLLLVVTAAALLAGAAAPSIALLSMATLVLSASTVLPQVIMPTIVSMATPGHAGRVLGAVGTGLTMGALLSRTASGLIAEATGTWRAGFAVAAVATGALLLVLPRYMPAEPPSPAGPRQSYLRLLASLPRLVTEHAPLRLSAALGATVFAAFSAFWSSLAFHLTEAPIALGPAVIGLFGLFSVPGALAARYSGRLTDRWGARRVNALALTSTLLAFALFGFAGQSLIALAVGCNLLGYGTTSGQIANQARIFGAQPAIRARLNTVYIFAVFAGGALGSAVAGVMFSAFGWGGVVGSGLGFVLLAGIVLVRHAVHVRRGGDRTAVVAGAVREEEDIRNRAAISASWE